MQKKATHLNEQVSLCRIIFKENRRSETLGREQIDCLRELTNPLQTHNGGVKEKNTKISSLSRRPTRGPVRIEFNRSDTSDGERSEKEESRVIK